MGKLNYRRGLAPKGYHIPTSAEWEILTDYLGGDHLARGDSKAVTGDKMKSTSGWQNNGNGNNASGFAGLPGGYRDNKGNFYYGGAYGNWWSSSEGNYAWYRNLSIACVNDFSSGFEQNGFSVRCLKDIFITRLSFHYSAKKMQKITINGYGFEYIRGYIDGAEKMDTFELMDADESIRVLSIRSCDPGVLSGFIHSNASFYNETTKEFFDLYNVDFPRFNGSTLGDSGFLIKEQLFLKALSDDWKKEKFNYEIFIDGKGALGEFEIDDDVKLENIILVIFSDAYEINENISDEILIGVIQCVDAAEKNIFVSLYEEAISNEDPELFKPAQDGKYKGMNFSEVFLEMQRKFTPIDYSNSSITGSINRL
jgi:uncharacterized protein (TIGR02145 family)